jgi:GDP-L-fucose synthase
MHFAKVQNHQSVSLWGDGTALREFLHVQDLARACMLLLNDYDSDIPINIGSGNEISIHNLAKQIAQVIGYKGEVTFEDSKLNGTPRKFLNSTMILNKGWKPQISLHEGIRTTYTWFLENYMGRQ